MSNSSVVHINLFVKQQQLEHSRSTDFP